MNGSNLFQKPLCKFVSVQRGPADFTADRHICLCDSTQSVACNTSEKILREILQPYSPSTEEFDSGSPL